MRPSLIEPLSTSKREAMIRELFPARKWVASSARTDYHCCKPYPCICNNCFAGM